jgi:hypothetical protein
LTAIFQIITEYYIPEEASRKEEIDTCFQKNLANTSVDRVVLCVESTGVLPEWVRQHPKVQVHVIPSRPGISKLLALAGKSTSPDTVTCIQNSDIYWEAEDVQLAKAHLQPGECYALTRWDVLPGGEAALHDVIYSQDAWVFRGRILQVDQLNCKLGMVAVDNVVAYQLHRAGYRVSNPARSIRTYHLHQSGVRQYTDSAGKRIVSPLPPPHLCLSPHQLGESCELSFAYAQGSIRSRLERMQILLGSFFFLFRPRKLAFFCEVPADVLSEEVFAFATTVRAAGIPMIVVVTPPVEGGIEDMALINRLKEQSDPCPNELLLLRAHHMHAEERNNLAIRLIRHQFTGITHVLHIAGCNHTAEQLTRGLHRLLRHPAYYNRVLYWSAVEAMVFPLRRRISFSEGKRMNWGSVDFPGGWD